MGDWEKKQIDYRENQVLVSAVNAIRREATDAMAAAGKTQYYAGFDEGLRRGREEGRKLGLAQAQLPTPVAGACSPPSSNPEAARAKAMGTGKSDQVVADPILDKGPEPAWATLVSGLLREAQADQSNASVPANWMTELEKECRNEACRIRWRASVLASIIDE